MTGKLLAFSFIGLVQHHNTKARTMRASSHPKARTTYRRTKLRRTTATTEIPVITPDTTKIARARSTRGSELLIVTLYGTCSVQSFNWSRIDFRYQWRRDRYSIRTRPSKYVDECHGSERRNEAAASLKMTSEYLSKNPTDFDFRGSMVIRKPGLRIRAGPRSQASYMAQIKPANEKPDL